MSHHFGGIPPNPQGQKSADRLQQIDYRARRRKGVVILGDCAAGPRGRVSILGRWCGSDLQQTLGRDCTEWNVGIVRAGGSRQNFSPLTVQRKWRTYFGSKFDMNQRPMFRFIHSVSI